MYLINGFSSNMLPAGVSRAVSFQLISVEKAAELAKTAESAVGHVDTASVYSTLLGVDVPANRTFVTLDVGDTALLGGYRGPRLAEGATELPDGARIDWYLVHVTE